MKFASGYAPQNKEFTIDFTPEQDDGWPPLLQCYVRGLPKPVSADTFAIVCALLVRDHISARLDFPQPVTTYSLNKVTNFVGDSIHAGPMRLGPIPIDRNSGTISIDWQPAMPSKNGCGGSFVSAVSEDGEELAQLSTNIHLLTTDPKDHSLLGQSTAYQTAALGALLCTAEGYGSFSAPVFASLPNVEYKRVQLLLSAIGVSISKDRVTV